MSIELTLGRISFQIDRAQKPLESLEADEFRVFNCSEITPQAREGIADIADQLTKLMAEDRQNGNTS